MLGLERSTIAQWRRRGSVPARYGFMLKMKHRDDVRQGMRHALRRQLYGDGTGRYLLAAALAFIPPAELEFGEELASGNLGWARESRVLSVVNVVLNACSLVLGKARCQTEADFIKLMSALEEPEWRKAIAGALAAAAIGEL